MDSIEQNKTKTSRKIANLTIEIEINFIFLEMYFIYCI